jgi:peptidoglycan DL-endopeptidase CwlO
VISRHRAAKGARPLTRVIRSSLLFLPSMALGAALLVVPAGVPAAADPPLTIEQAKAQISALEAEAEALDQQYVAVEQQVKAGKAKLKLKRADVSAQIARVDKIKFQVGQFALAQFQNRDLGVAAQLVFNSDAEDFLSQISTVQKVSENQNSVLQDFQQQQADLADLERSAEGDLAVLTQQEKELKALSAASEKKIAESKAVLARLTAEERQRLAAAQKKAAADARKTAEKSTGGSTTKKSTGGSTKSSRSKTRDPLPVSSGTTSGRGAKALAFAKAQLGKPYVRNASGPNAYDCSGLTMASWRYAGVSIPRTSTAQYSVGRWVAKSDLQLGDLVFFYSGISHVALYAGNGLVIHAPHPGASVEYIKMSYMPYMGARRPG